MYIIEKILAVLWYGSIVMLGLTCIWWVWLSTEEGSFLVWAEVTADCLTDSYSVSSNSSGESLRAVRIDDHDFEVWQTDTIMRSPSLFYSILFVLALLLEAWIWVAIIYLLRRVLATRAELNLTAEAVSRLKIIGLLVFFGPLVVYLTEFGLLNVLDSLVVTNGYQIKTDFDPDVGTLMYTFIVLAITQWIGTRHRGAAPE